MKMKHATSGKSPAYGKREIGNLIKACRKGDLANIRKLLKLGIPIDTIDELCGARPLTASVRGGHLKIVQFLLEAGAEPNAQDTWKSMPPEGTPLENAARSGHLEIAKLLIDRGAKPDLKGDVTPIESAAAHGHSELVRFLLKRGVSFDSSLLLRAVRKGNIDVIRQLIAAGADVNYQDEDGKTALHVAAVKQSDAVARLLIEAGARLDVQTKYINETPLMRAAQKGTLSIVEALLKAGADATLRGHQNKTAELWAKAYGHPDVAEFIRSFVKGNAGSKAKPSKRR